MTDSHNRPEFDLEELPPISKPIKKMSNFKKGIYLVLAGTFLAGGVTTIAYPQGAVTLVQLVLGGQAVSNSNPLPVTVTGGGGGGLSVQDQATFTQGTSNFTPAGGEFNDTSTVSSGQQGTFRMTTKRAQIMDTDTTGNALYSAITAAVPCLNATAFNTNSYSNAGTNAANCNLNGGLFVDLGKNLGTAGTANAGVITVQGIASMTKLLVTPDSVALPANQSVNVSQVNGVTTLTGTGATGTGAQRVTVSTDQATNAGAALVKGGVGTVNGGSTENTVAASQTNQILSSTQGGGTGTTGDYLSHCIIQPATTSPGAFTILDNATTVYSFPGGASSVSNLVPFAIPLGITSKSGGFKITTTTNVSGTCTGSFT